MTTTPNTSAKSGSRPGSRSGSGCGSRVACRVGSGVASRLAITAVLLAGISLAPAAASAGWGIEASLGKGYRVKPSAGAETSNVMVAPGYGLLGLVRAEVGLLAALPDIKSSKFDLEVRPMIVVAPPLLPLYGRVVLAVTNLLGNNGDTGVAYGGALGLKLGLGPVGVFAEAGLLPRSRAGQLNWVIEGRAGAYFGF